MNRFFKNLRASILTTFSVLLFLSFALVGAAFNLAVNQYIKRSAIAQLTDSSLSLVEILKQSLNVPEDTAYLYPGTISVNDPHHNIFRMNLNAFILDGTYRFVDQQRMPTDAQAIAEMLRNEGVSLALLNNRRVKTANRTYYITAAKTTLLFEGDAPVYMIYYVDVTELIRFTASVNLLLLSLVGAIWLLCVMITTFLAGFIARPIRQLGLFAERIGKGDFSPNPVMFRNAEFNSLNQSLNHTARQLNQYDNEQKTFFQNVSHELRTPLMSIKCYAEGIQYGLMEPNRASQTILSETDRLTRMIDDLLYVSKIDNLTGARVYDHADLRDLLNTCINQHQAVADNRRIALVWEKDGEPVVVPCVVDQISRAFNNMLANALRYAHSRVRITCRVVDAGTAVGAGTGVGTVTAVGAGTGVDAGGAAVVTIEDDGPGIPSRILPHIFERFYKGSDGQHGIGLSIVKSVIEQHGGTVKAQNRVPAGDSRDKNDRDNRDGNADRDSSADRDGSVDRDEKSVESGCKAGCEIGFDSERETGAVFTVTLPCCGKQSKRKKTSAR